MKHVAIDVYQDERQGLVATLTVADALKRAQQLDHAGEQHIQQLLDNPQKTPSVVLEKPADGKVNGLLFGGKIHIHENGSKYLQALRIDRLKALVVEKYWLADPLPNNLYFAVLY